MYLSEMTYPTFKKNSFAVVSQLYFAFSSTFLTMTILESLVTFQKLLIGVTKPSYVKESKT